MPVAATIEAPATMSQRRGGCTACLLSDPIRKPYCLVRQSTLLARAFVKLPAKLLQSVQSSARW